MKTILFPTDFSENANNALKFALEIAERSGSKVVLFNSFWVPLYEFDTPEEIDKKEKKFRVESLKELVKLERAIKIAYPEIPLETMILNNFTAEAIVSASELVDADLIVMGTKGASGLREIIMGSNSVDVINKSKRPILVIPEKAKEVRFGNFVFATNYGERDVEEIDFLVKLAELFNAEITVIHVSEEEFLGNYADTVMLKKLKKNIHSTIIYEKLAFKQLKGEVIEELTKYIAENNVDLISMVTTQKEFLGKIFSKSFTHKMAFHSEIPLLVLHE